MADENIVQVTREDSRTTTSKAVDDLDFAGALTEFYIVEFREGSDPRFMPVWAADTTHITQDGQPVPAEWDSHPADPWMFVQSKSVTCIGTYLYEVQVNYSRVEEPLAQSIKLAFNFACSSEPIDRTPDGSIIQNTADEPFDPGITADFFDLIISITRNTPQYSAGVAADMIGSVNSDKWWGLPAGVARLQAWDGEPARAGGVKYWAETLEIAVRYDTNNPLACGWIKRVVDEGYRTKAGLDTETGMMTYEAIKDKDGNPLSQPALLDGAGGRLPDGEDPVFILVNANKRRKFESLDLIWPEGW